MAKSLSKSAREAMAEVDWAKLDALTDTDIARQIAAEPDAAPDMAPEIDVRHSPRQGLSQSEFAAAYEFNSVISNNGNGAQAPKRTRAHALAGHP